MAEYTVTNECFKARVAANARPPAPLHALTEPRGGTAIFQVLIASPARCIVNPGNSPALSYELGLPRYRVSVSSPFPASVYTEKYLPDENGVLTADLLSPAPQTYDGGYAPVCVVIDVPENTAPGTYDVAVNIYHAHAARDEEKVFSRVLPLTVSPLVLPPPTEYLDLWQHNCNIARTFGVEIWSDEHFVLIDKSLSALARLGQKSVTVLASDCPWRGWGCYLLKERPATLYEYSIVPVHKSTDGGFRYDFTHLKRYIDLCFSHGIDGDITVYGLMGIWTNMPLFPHSAPADYPEKVSVRYLDAQDGCYKYMTKKEDVEAYIRALFAFLRKEKLFDKVRIGADEPCDLDAYARNYELLRSIEPDVQFKMALDTQEAVERFAPLVSDIAASFPCACSCGELLRRAKQDGKRVLFYVCNIPDRPNSVLHSDLTELYALGCISHLFGFDGFLRWAFTCWTLSPADDIRYNDSALPAGDVNFVYPAKNGDILYSLRYFALLKALQIRELLRLSDTQTAEEAIGKVIKNKDTQTYMRSERQTHENIYSLDYNDYRDAVNLLIHKLEKEETLCRRG